MGFGSPCTRACCECGTVHLTNARLGCVASAATPASATLTAAENLPPRLLITPTPAGEAPLWVREQWVGLALPLAQGRDGARLFVTSGVLSGPRTVLARLLAVFTGRYDVRSGYAVEARAAVAILEAKSPEAAAWWREHAAHQLAAGRYFVFGKADGRVEGDAG